MSAESGLKTFRDSNGLWEGHNIMEVATPEAFERDPGLVLEFYNQRRRQLLEVHPNFAHKTISELETNYKVSIITQNVDDLHERAGSSFVLHLHGELFKVRSTKNESNIQSWRKDLFLGDLCKDGFQLRPHIVWFGEEDQLRIMCMKRGTKLNEVFDRLKTMLDTIESIDGITFATSSKYGYVTSCPSNLGTGMRASVHVKIPNLTADGTENKAKAVCKPLGLSVRGTGGEHA